MLKLNKKISIYETIEKFYKLENQNKWAKMASCFSEVYNFLGTEKRKILNRKVEEIISFYENEVNQKLLIVNGTIRRWSREKEHYTEFINRNIPSIYKLYILENLRNSTCISSFEAMSEEIKKLMASEYNSKDEKMAIVIEIVNLKQKLRKEMFESALNISKDFKDFCCYLSERKIRFCSIKNESVYSLGGIFCEEKTAGEYTRNVIKEVLNSIIPEVGIVESINVNILEISSYLEKEFESVSWRLSYNDTTNLLCQQKSEKARLENLMSRLEASEKNFEYLLNLIFDGWEISLKDRKKDIRKLSQKEANEIEDFILTVIKDKLDKLVFKK